MRIVFSTPDGEIDSYPIKYIEMGTDDDGIPCDIIITSRDQQVLDVIAEKHCVLGYNCQEVMSEDNCVELGDGSLSYVPQPTGVYEALYGRLEQFRIEW